MARVLSGRCQGARLRLKPRVGPPPTWVAVAQGFVDGLYESATRWREKDYIAAVLVIGSVLDALLLAFSMGLAIPLPILAVIVEVLR